MDQSSTTRTEQKSRLSFVDRYLGNLVLFPSDLLLLLLGMLSSRFSFPITWMLFLAVLVIVVHGFLAFCRGPRIGEHVESGEFVAITPHQLAIGREYFDAYGLRSIAMLEFIPVVRTVIAVVAAERSIGALNYALFKCPASFVRVLFLIAFGAGPMVQKNFELVVVGIVFLSLLPPAWEFAAHRLAQRKQPVVPIAEPAQTSESMNEPVS